MATPSSPRPPAARPSMPLFTVLAIGFTVIGIVMMADSSTRWAGLAFVVAAAGLIALPAVQRRRGRRVVALAGGGREATARIVTVHTLRPRGGIRRLRVQYVITPDGRPPYRLTTRHPLPPGMESTFTAGNVIRVRVDPQDPKNVVFVADDI